MLLAVFQIIAESVPNLHSLSLSDNKIFSTEHFSMLKKHAGELKSLNLSKNRVSSIPITYSRCINRLLRNFFTDHRFKQTLLLARIKTRVFDTG